MHDSSLYGHPFTRRMWMDLDHILLIYVGSAAEFPLVEDNHWLFYTDKLPSAPWDRFTSTFAWNRKIMLTPREDAAALARKIRGFHTTVEQQRSADEGAPRQISNDAFLAVGFMLVDYALLANAYLERRRPAPEECEAYYADQRGFYQAMGIDNLPATYADFQSVRARQLRESLRRNQYTDALFQAYRRDLGPFRYHLMRHFMAWFVPDPIRQTLGLPRHRAFGLLYRLYPRLRCRPLSRLLHLLLLPARVRKALALPD